MAAGRDDESNIVAFRQPTSLIVRPKGTAASTIEALLYELRGGLSCLADEGAVGRLRSCDADAMRTIAAELLAWKDRGMPWLPPWTEDDAAKLVAVWRTLR
jgi:hypothetical protein